MRGRPKQDQGGAVEKLSPTPFTDALKQVLAERYGTTWQEAYRLLKAGAKPDQRGR